MAVRTWKATRESSHGSLQSTWERERGRERDRVRIRGDPNSLHRWIPSEIQTCFSENITCLCQQVSFPRPPSCASGALACNFNRRNWLVYGEDKRSTCYLVCSSITHVKLTKRSTVSFCEWPLAVPYKQSRCRLTEANSPSTSNEFNYSRCAYEKCRAILL